MRAGASVATRAIRDADKRRLHSFKVGDDMK